ncbi:hypothetical protein [Streptomyces nigrescens]|uniref:hypothetical protein n=1 Tax=Streptomyces nigrescens TaxID=1920 RepID=UPI0036FC08BC
MTLSISELRTIEEAEAKRTVPDGAQYTPVRHYVEFTAADRHLMTFDSLGPMLLPAVGQHINIHSVPVLVVDVETTYELHEDGQPIVFTEVAVTAPSTTEQ